MTESWASLPEHPEHPQAGMAELLRNLGATREEVAYVPGSEPDGARRARLHLRERNVAPGRRDGSLAGVLGKTMRGARRPRSRQALAGVCKVETPTAHDEAEAIALILRRAIETPGKTAALVTPDRMLARRVAARLKRYDLVIDDSAGVPVARTVPGAFLDLVLGAAASGLRAAGADGAAQAPAHAARPCSRQRSGRLRARWNAAPSATSMSARGSPARGRRSKRPHATDRARPAGSEPNDEHAAALRLVADLEAAFAPLTALLPIGTNTRPRRWPRPMSPRLRLWRRTRGLLVRLCGRAMPARPCRCCWPS